MKLEAVGASQNVPQVNFPSQAAKKKKLVDCMQDAVTLSHVPDVQKKRPIDLIFEMS
jgi:hypothetical protein